MNELWSQRSRNYHRIIFKYLRYVLNDHLVLAMMFFIGGAGLAYSSWLQELTTDSVIIRPLVVIVIGIMTTLGKPILLLKEPDKIFLMPQERLILNDFMKKSYRLTSIFRLLIMLIVSMILTPLMGLILHTWIAVALFSLQMFLISLINLRIDYQQFFFSSWKVLWIYKLLGALIMATFGVLVSPILTLILTLGIGALVWAKFRKPARLSWLSAINFETKRMNGLYRFFSLFTNVPQLESKPKRRHYLAPFISMLSPKSSSPFEYIYGRAILRGGELGGLVLRLLVLAVLIISFSDSLGLKILISVVALYLMVVQTVVVYPQISQNVLTKVYPLEIDAAQRALRNIILKLSIGFSVVLIIAATISMTNILDLVWIAIGQALVIFLVITWFIPRYIKKVGEQI